MLFSLGDFIFVFLCGLEKNNLWVCQDLRDLGQRRKGAATELFHGLEGPCGYRFMKSAVRDSRVHVIVPRHQIMNNSQYGYSLLPAPAEISELEILSN